MKSPSTVQVEFLIIFKIKFRGRSPAIVVLFSSQFQSYVSDAGQNFPFHVVPDEELQ